MAPDRRLHFREVRVQGLHHVGRRGRFHPRGEVAQVGEEDGDVECLAAEGHAPGEDLVADLARDVTPEGLLDLLALPETLDHAVEALGHRPDLVGADHQRALVEVAARDAVHGPLDLAQRLRHAARDVERQQHRHHEAYHRHEEHEDHEVLDEARRLVGAGPAHGRDAGVGDEPEERDGERADEQEDAQKPRAHAEAGDAGHAAQVAGREVAGQHPPPLMLDGQEDEGRGEHAGDHRGAEERAKRVVHPEGPGHERPEDAPDDSRHGPSGEGHQRDGIGQEQGALADAFVDRRGGILAMAKEGTEPPVAEGEPDRAQQGKRHAGEDELPGAGPGSAGAGVDVAKVEKRDDGAEQAGAERHGRVLTSAGVGTGAGNSRLRRGCRSSVHARIIALRRDRCAEHVRCASHVKRCAARMRAATI